MRVNVDTCKKFDTVDIDIAGGSEPKEGNGYYKHFISRSDVSFIVSFGFVGERDATI